ncbi:nucleoside-triphosphate diphosphatase [Aureococcus anophagefferens]|nr:nucleoside-triphosphate diphosphatase [Aureococcus anophagefferens]
MLLKEALQSVTAIVLASGSPRRRELLGQMLPKDVSFVVQKSTFDEDLPKGDDAALYCVRTAEKKGEEVCAAINDPSRLIISADTVVAGGYGIQGRAGAFVQRVDGCYYNVVGFPLNRLSGRSRRLAET